MQRARRFVQSLSLLLLHSSWGPEAKWFCTPIYSCHACPLSWFACPVGVFIHYSGYRVFPFLAVGTLVVFGALLGRMLCGWVCPFGFLQDLLHRIPSRKFTAPGWTASIKYVVLALTVFLIPFFLGADTLFSFCRFCPAAAIQVTLPWAAKNGFGAFQWYQWVKIGLMVVTLIAAVFSSRLFCKVLCPIGALMAVFNYVSFWRVKVPTQACVSCSECDKVCPTDVNPSERILKGLPPSHNLDCVLCHECRSVCPVKEKSAERELA